MPEFWKKLYLSGNFELSCLQPDSVLIDLNLPKMNGLEVVAEIKKESDLRRIPVFILTVSNAEQDILKSCNLQTNCYRWTWTNFSEWSSPSKTSGPRWSCCP